MLPDRFWSKVRQDGDCWIWTAALNKGYGVSWLDGKTRQAHRMAYEDMVADIPAGLTLDHLCRRPACVNPYHLEPVPIGINVLRNGGPSAQQARWTHCPRGHEFSAENTYYRKDRYGRMCQACQKAKYIARRDGLSIEEALAS